MPIAGDFEKLWSGYPMGFTRDHSPGVDEDAESERIARLGAELKRSIGGKVDDPDYNNLCVVRLSYAMNRGGMEISDNTPLKWYGGKPYKVAKGGDGFYYGLGVTETRHYLQERHGKPDQEISKPFEPDAKGDRAPGGIKGKQGILLFLVSIWNDASGHVTLWNGSQCSDNDYFEQAEKILFWEVVKPDQKPVRIPNLNDSIRLRAFPVPVDSPQ